MYSKCLSSQAKPTMATNWALLSILTCPLRWIWPWAVKSPQWKFFLKAGQDYSHQSTTWKAIKSKGTRSSAVFPLLHYLHLKGKLRAWGRILKLLAIWSHSLSKQGSIAVKILSSIAKSLCSWTSERKLYDFTLSDAEMLKWVLIMVFLQVWNDQEIAIMEEKTAIKSLLSCPNVNCYHHDLCLRLLEALWSDIRHAKVTRYIQHPREIVWFMSGKDFGGWW